LKHQILTPEFQSALALIWIAAVLIPLGVMVAWLAIALAASAFN
jgi:hypothetical protein